MIKKNYFRREYYIKEMSLVSIQIAGLFWVDAENWKKLCLSNLNTKVLEV